MNAQYRDILKHSGVYGLGQVLGRFASIILLPVQTRYLTPADYGTIAILDLTSTVLAILVSGGLAAALNRYHFEAETPEAQGTVWWTGLTVVAMMTVPIVLPAFVFRNVLAVWTLGARDTSGGFYYALTLATLCFNVISQIPTVYFRARKWSWLTVNLSLVSLVLNIGLNLFFLIVRHWGVLGVLSGNLITLVVMSAVQLIIFATACGRFRFNRPIAMHLTRFGGPIVLTLLLATAMHQVDRYLLSMFVDLGQVGVYSLAYQMGQGLNALFAVPFGTIWAAVIYDIAKQPDAKQTYARVFEYYVYILLLLLFGVSLMVKPLLVIFATPQYAAAAPLVPIVCLSFVFFSVDDHFRVPALLAKRTANLIPANAAGAVANIILNLIFIPRFGAIAAAWVSVATYAIFSGVDLVLCRRIDRFNYPLARCACVLGAMIASFIACHYVQTWMVGIVGSIVVPVIVWLVWAGALSYVLLRRLSTTQSPVAAAS